MGYGLHSYNVDGYSTRRLSGRPGVDFDVKVTPLHWINRWEAAGRGLRLCVAGRLNLMGRRPARQLAAQPRPQWPPGTGWRLRGAWLQRVKEQRLDEAAAHRLQHVLDKAGRGQLAARLVEMTQPAWASAWERCKILPAATYGDQGTRGRRLFCVGRNVLGRGGDQ
jgi:hypothetical protein